jgi:hypothetical protein
LSRFNVGGLRLLKRIVTVSLETMKIVDALPAMDFLE